MRYAIWEEDDFFHFNGKRIDMDVSAVFLPSEPLPLTFQFNWDKPPYGLIRDLDRDAKTITGEMEIFELPDDASQNQINIELLLKETCRLGGFYKNVHYTDETKTRVSQCELRGVSIMVRQDVMRIPKVVRNGEAQQA